MHRRSGFVVIVNHLWCCPVPVVNLQHEVTREGSGVELDDSGSAVETAHQEHLVTVAVVDVKEACRLLVLPRISLVAIEDVLIFVVPLDRVSVWSDAGVRFIAEFYDVELVVHNEREVEVAVVIFVHLVMNTVVSPEPGSSCTVIQDRIELEEAVHMTSGRIELDNDRLVVKPSGQDKGSSLVKLTAGERLEREADIVVEATPLPVAFEVHGVDEAVIVRGRNEVFRGRVTNDNDLLVLLVVHDTGDLLIFVTTDTHREDLFLTLFGHDAGVQRKSEHQAHEQ